MKITIDKIGYGWAPFGPGYGTKVFHIGFKEVEGDYELKDILDENGKPLEDASDIEKISNILVEELQNKIAQENLQNEFSTSLVDSFIYISGDEIIKNKDNTEITENLLKIFEGVSFEFQKKFILNQNPNADLTKMKFKRLNSVFVCEPKYFTGSRKAYELFQTVLCKLPLREKPFTDTAMVEIEGYKNVFHIIEITDNYEKELGFLKSEYLDTEMLSISPFKTFVSMNTSKPEAYEKIKETDFIITRKLIGDLDI